MDDIDYDVFYALLAYLLPDLQPVHDYVESLVQRDKSVRVLNEKDESLERGYILTVYIYKPTLYTY